METRDAQEPTSCSANELRTIRTLLWSEISSQLRPAERDEVKGALGRTLIEENESLFSEADALSEILGQVQASTAAVLDRQRLCSNPNRNMVCSACALAMQACG